MRVACYYPGWVQKVLPPASLPWDAINVVCHFGRYPTSSGTLPIADMQSEGFHAPLVAAARAHGAAALLTIGGGGNFGGTTIGQQFAAACSSTATRSRLVQAAVDLVTRFGYDGLDVDWEEAVPGSADAYVTLLEELRAALGTGRLLTAAVVSGLVSGRIAARAAAVVDRWHLMSYWSDGADQLAHYTAAGIASSRCVLGAGFSADPDFFDKTAADVRAKVAAARAGGAAGVMFWQAGDLRPTATTDPRLQPLREVMMPVTYPGAAYRPLGPQTQPRLGTHEVVCLHTAVGSLAGTDSYFRDQGFGGTESHFGVGGKWGPDAAAGLDGVVYQWQDLDYTADANYEGNDRVISIETADNAPQLPADIEAWTPAQLDAIVALVAWLCRTYDIPARLVPDTRPGTRGIGYHAQGTAASLPAGWERWSTTVGKPCPTTRRINQLISVVIPRVQLALDQEEDDMSQADVDAINAHTDQVVAVQVAAAQTEILRQLTANLGPSAVNNPNAWLNSGIAVRIGANTRALVAPLLDDEAQITASVQAAHGDLAAAIAAVQGGGAVPEDPKVYADAVLDALRDRLVQAPPPA